MKKTDKDDSDISSEREKFSAQPQTSQYQNDNSQIPFLHLPNHPYIVPIRLLFLLPPVPAISPLANNYGPINSSGSIRPNAQDSYQVGISGM